MSFSAEIKEELSKLNTYNKPLLQQAEFVGYLISNASIIDEQITFTTTNLNRLKRIFSVIEKITKTKVEKPIIKNKNTYCLQIPENVVGAGLASTRAGTVTYPYDLHLPL